MFDQVGLLYQAMIAMLVIVMIFIAATILFTVAAINRQALLIPARVDDLNNSVVSYIQKNGGWNTRADTVPDLDVYLKRLIKVHGLARKGIDAKVTVQVYDENMKKFRTITGNEPRSSIGVKSGNRGTKYRVVTQYSIPRATLGKDVTNPDGTTNRAGFFIFVKFVPAQDKNAIALVHEYDKR